MMNFERLDAWKACHALALAVYQATDDRAAKPHEQHVHRLRLAAILAPAKLAHGSARRSRKTFQRFVEIALGHLVELAYYLRVARERKTFPNEDVQQLNALRGRATFYTWKLYLSLAPTPDAGSPEDG